MAFGLETQPPAGLLAVIAATHEKFLQRPHLCENRSSRKRWALILSKIDASAAEVRFLCADSLETSMRELIPEFQKATGHSVR
jgi:hypothetical protein